MTIKIAARLWVEGQYVTYMNPSQTQRLTDLQWAAYKAGRVLGGRAKIHISKAPDHEDLTFIVTVTFVNTRGRGPLEAEEGLVALMRMALDQHTGS